MIYILGPIHFFTNWLVLIALHGIFYHHCLYVKSVYLVTIHRFDSPKTVMTSFSLCRHFDTTKIIWIPYSKGSFCLIVFVSTLWLGKSWYCLITFDGSPCCIIKIFDVYELLYLCSWSSQVYTTSKSVVERFDAVGRFRGSFSVFTILMFEKYPIIYKQKDVIWSMHPPD